MNRLILFLAIVSLFGIVFLVGSVSAVPYADCTAAQAGGVDFGGRQCEVVTSCPQTLSQNRYYLVTQDLSSTGTCLTIGADDLVLDLNEHTITFDTANAGSANGIFSSGVPRPQNYTITSSQGKGRVIQDTGCPLATTECSGDRAINLPSPLGVNVSNVYIGIQGYDTHGIYFSGISSQIYRDNYLQIVNNTINHSGTHLSSRGGFTSMPVKFYRLNMLVNFSHNNILDSPHGGLMLDNGGQPAGSMDDSIFSYNYIDIDDAYYANPTGILFFGGYGVNVHHNTFVGDGMEGLQFDGPNLGPDGRIRIYDNFFNLSTIRWPRGQTAGAGSMQGIRMRYGVEHVDIYNNHIIARAHTTSYELESSAFAIWMSCWKSGDNCLDVRIWNNTLEAYTDGTPSGGYNGGIGYAVALTLGGIVPSTDIQVFNNTLRSNNIVLGFHDGTETNMSGDQFYDNTFDVITPTYGSGVSVLADYIETAPIRLTFRDSSFQGAATKTSFSAQRSTDTLTHEWSFDVLVRDNGIPVVTPASVSIVNDELTTVYSGSTTNGVIPTQYLPESTFTISTTLNQYSPYNVTVTYLGETQSRLVSMDTWKTEVFDFYSSSNSPDVNSDGNVNVIDLALVIFNYGSPVDGSGYDHLDIDGDSDVDFGDAQAIIVYI